MPGYAEFGWPPGWGLLLCRGGISLWPSGFMGILEELFAEPCSRKGFRAVADLDT